MPSEHYVGRHRQYSGGKPQVVGGLVWCEEHQEFHPWPDMRDKGYWDGWITPGLPGFMQ